MLPPIAPSVLESNPKFKTLYTNLAGSRLNADASTRLIKQQRAQADIEKQLVVARKEAAQRALLQHALQAIASRLNDLPPELIETCHIVSAQLVGTLSEADLDILADDIDFFLTSIPRISPVLSTHLEETGRLISQLAFAGSDDDVLKLAAQASALQESISNQSTSISVTRSRITDLATTLHATYRTLLEVSIRLLEQTLHGSISRGVRAQAEHLATVAKGLELKLQVMASTDAMLTDPALQTELESYRTRLETRAGELSSQVAGGERTLAEYGKAGKGMLEIAKRYAEVKKECDAVKDEIGKLEARQTDVD